jgi:hypothetical protein
MLYKFTVNKMRTTTEKRKAKKPETILGESLKKEWEIKSMLGSNIINIERRVSYDDNMYMAVEGDGKAEIERALIVAH